MRVAAGTNRKSQAGKRSKDEELITQTITEWVVPALARHIMAARPATNGCPAREAIKECRAGLTPAASPRAKH